MRKSLYVCLVRQNFHHFHVHAKAIELFSFPLLAVGEIPINIFIIRNSEFRYCILIQKCGNKQSPEVGAHFEFCPESGSGE